LGNLDKLRACFTDTFELPDDYDVEALTYRGVEEWDSVAHMALVAEIENVFDVMLETNDVLDMSSWPKAVEILEKHGVAF
jgi:acyl carrier protein